MRPEARPGTRAKAMRVLIVDLARSFPAARIVLEKAGHQVVYVHGAVSWELDSFGLGLGESAVRGRDLGLRDVEGLGNDQFEVGLVVLRAVDFLREAPIGGPSVTVHDRILDLLQRKVISGGHRVLIDNDDYPHPVTGGSLGELSSYDVILKREYRQGFSYPAKYRPFPYVVFGSPDPVQLWLESKPTRGSWRRDKVYWSGVPFVHVDHSLDYRVSRLRILTELVHSDLYQDLSIAPTRLPFKWYLQMLRHHSFFLNLRGVGDVNRRFFEGLAMGAIPLMESFDVRFPTEHADLEQELAALSFRNPSQGLEVLDSLRARGSKWRRDFLGLVRARINSDQLARLLVNA